MTTQQVCFTQKQPQYIRHKELQNKLIQKQNKTYIKLQVQQEISDAVYNLL